MKKTTYNNKKNKTKETQDDLELTNIYKYKGAERTKAKIKNNAKIAKNEANKLKNKYKKGSIGQKILIIFMLFLILCLTLGIIFTLYIIIHSPKFDTSNLYKKESSVLLDKNGNEFARLGTENREVVTYEDLPQVLIDAIVATEDSRFFQHNGVDLARFSKAVVGQLLGHSNAGGGSTLTMQVVKLTYTSSEDSGIEGIIRKFTDIYMSVFKVEKSYTKEQILEFYVNIPYLGSGAYGVEQACQVYFGKSVDEISLSEAALIAGLFQAPGSYDPYSHPELAETRKNQVLNLMYRHGYISEEVRDLAKSITVESMLAGNTKTLNKYQGFVDTVVSEVIKRTGNDPATTSMTIYTTLDPEKQDVIENIYTDYKWKNDVVQAAMTVIDVKDGSIAAIGAGRNKKTERSLNLAADPRIKRHPGSTAKPIFDYGPAIEYLNWSTGQTVVDDTFKYTSGGSIKNWDNKYYGIMTAKQALAQSRNIPALYTYQQLNQEQIKEFVTNLGIEPEYENGYINESHSIGGFNGVNTLQMAAAYATFARGGTYIEPYSFTKLEYTNSDETYTVKPTKRKAMSESTAYMINMMLKYAVTSGAVTTGTVSGTDVASKTGTSTVDSSAKKANGITGSVIGDSWQMTYSPDYSIALWYGYENQITKDYYLTQSEGSSNRRAISKILGSKILKTNSTWEKPTSVVSADIELETDPLELPSAATPTNLISNEYFKKGTTPSETSIRFQQLENPKNLTYTKTESGITLSWQGIETPKAIDITYLTDYFANNVYKYWGDKYLNKRIEYNNSVLGTLAYSIYINGNYIGTTTQTNYTYNGTITDNSDVVVKSTYTNYAACESSGTSIIVTLSGITSPSTDANNNDTNDNNNNQNNNDTSNSDTNEFTISLNGTNPMTKETFNNLILTNGLVTVTSNGKDVTNKSIITYECDDGDCSSDTFRVFVTIKYSNNSKTKSFTVSN